MMVAALITLALLLVVVGAPALIVARNARRSIPPSTPLERPGARFPDGFLWGTGEDPYQHEGYSTKCDWHRWQYQEQRPIDDGDVLESGTDFWNRWREDFQRAKDDGQTAHRIGIDWSRIEPEQDSYDEEALARYVEMVRTMKEEHGFVTFVNLWHFTLPLWAAEMGGFENPELMKRWERYVELCAKALGPWVDYWSTMIDSQLYALVGYLLGDIPPCVKNAKRTLVVYRTLIDAHARAYRLLKRHARRASEPSFEPQVGQIYFFFDFHCRGFIVDPLVRKRVSQVSNWSFLDALVTGDVDIELPFQRLREQADDVKGTLDWLGINYFTRAVVAFDPFTPGLLSQKRQTPYMASDMEWEIFPEGLYNVIRDVRGRYGDELPLFVTECGIADFDDSRRPRFIVDHLAWLHKAIEDGANVKGFFYWSSTDNWEWKHGSWPRFGIYRVDYQTKERIELASTRLYRRIARENRLPDDDELPPKLPLYDEPRAVPRTRQQGKAALDGERLPEGRATLPID